MPGLVVRGISRWGHRLRWAYVIPTSSVLSLWYQASRNWRSFADFAQRSQTEQQGEGELNVRKSRGPGPTPGTIITAVRLGTRWPPFRSTCLVRSLVLARLLRFYGHPATVVIGVPHEGWETAGDWFAHAWVDMGIPTNTDEYQELIRLAMPGSSGAQT